MSSYSAKSALVGGTMDEGSFRSEDESKNESSHSGTQASFNQNANGDDEYSGIAAAKELRETIIKHEEKAVRRSRVMVAVAIIICSVAVTVVVYFLTKKSEQNSFELEFDGIVKDIKSLVRWEVRYNFALMEQLSASVTIAAVYLNSTFPFHTEPQFEISGGFVDGMGGIMSAAFAPLVREDQLEEWSTYATKNQGWIEESAYLKKVHPAHRDALHGTIQDHEHDRRRHLSSSVRKLLEDETKSVSPYIYRWENGVKVREYQPGKLYAPLWQVSPADYGAVNVNLLSDPLVAALYVAMRNANMGVLSSSFEVGDLFDFLFDPEEKHLKKDPHGIFLQPVYEKIEEKENSTIVGFLIAITPFGNLLDRLLPEGKDGVIGVFKDDCGKTLSYELSSNKARFLGYEDMHEPQYNEYVRIERNIEMYDDRTEGVCTHDLYIYPTEKLRISYETNHPALYTTLVAFAFFVVICLFAFYDWTITRRQNKTIASALKTQAIVTSLFPEEVGKTLIKEAYEEKQGPGFKKNTQDANTSDDFDSNAPRNQATLAKLYPEATVLFGDLVGFTAWSSMRDPPQVFRLLETLYSAFDNLAKRRTVFKVETIGDCYVAVCGLPQERKNHHVIMARFARDCLHAIGPLLRKLELELGPDTSDLGIRIGLNSGQVTAGVLRADRARFQLFGDTVNVAARMESTGIKNMIHISKETADLLIGSGRGHWVTPRAESVHAKGKGQLQTFWLEVKNDAAVSSSSEGESSSAFPREDQESILEKGPVSSSLEMKSDTGNNQTVLEPKARRLVDWNTDILLRILRDVVSHRVAKEEIPDSEEELAAAEVAIQKPGTIVFDELIDIISLPSYDREGMQRKKTSAPAELSQAVMDQLKEYVTCIAGLYRNNPFHNFEHASHVTMSVHKLLSRIVSPSLDSSSPENLHDNTYGITSDPLTQLAVVLSALIHDVDHSGVPNALLVKENASIAALYRNKSVAEQNSVDLAWNLLMQDSYKDLRRAIYSNTQELRRFRQIVVVTVMATDIADKELKERRNARWKKAFSDGSTSDRVVECSKKEDTDRKATIVIEHIIQASDVAHTMQHWHIYHKWNERLFYEMYETYKTGRSDVDPSSFWYKGELGFFDFYIIPLAKKLKECGVFGVSGDEYLSYAQKNRCEWETKGAEVVETYLAKLRPDD